MEVRHEQLGSRIGNGIAIVRERSGSRSGFGKEVARLSRSRPRSSSQVAHVDAQVGVSSAWLAPQTACSSWRWVRTHSGMRGEKREQPVLDRRQVHRCVAPVHGAARQVRRTSPNAMTPARRPPARPGASAQLGAHARQQFADAEGLGQVVVGPGVQRGDLVRLGRCAPTAR